MKKSELIQDNQRQALANYPIYSQDGKGGEAVALFRIIITGTTAQFLIMEGQLDGEYNEIENFRLYGVSNMERDGWRYDYFSSAELEGLDLYGGRVRAMIDPTFTPCKLKELPEVAGDLAEIWTAEQEEAEG